MSFADPACLSWWYPPLVRAGLRVPATRIVRCELPLVALLDGVPVEGIDGFLLELEEAVAHIGTPCFLRTGHTAGKHDWARTCALADIDDLPAHVVSLVEYSHIVDPWGLPTDVWAVRERIATTPLFRCAGFADFPVTREFRLFASEAGVEHLQPYWPADALADARPDVADWQERLARAAALVPAERTHLEDLAVAAAAAVGGAWSVDCLEDRDGGWWITDMAPAERSFRYAP